MKSILKTFLFSVLLCASVVNSAPVIWDGTADVSWYEESAQAYNIVSAEQLAGLAKLVNEGTSDFSGKTITLGANLFLNDTTGAGDGSWYSKTRRTWTPIGTSSHPFKGEFDGIAGKNNRKIYGLYVNSSSANYVGLFGYTGNVKISNLDILVGQISAIDNVGSLAGYTGGGLIINVRSEVNVDGRNRVGGMIGFSWSNISKCSGKGNVFGQDSVGGLIGISRGSVSGTSSAKSSFVGTVKGRKYVGGVVGDGRSIEYSYSDAVVGGDSGYVGGVAGAASGKVQFVYHANGTVSGHSYVGGLVGITSNSVEDSYSLADVLAEGNYAGGLIGLSYHVSKSAEETYITKNSYSVGNVIGGDYVGGLVGFDSLMVFNENRLIKESYMEGNVSGVNYVGGILGRSYKNVSISSSDTGSLSIESSYHVNGDVSGTNSVGGVAGRFSGNVLNSFNKGNVEGTSYVGGVVGYLDWSRKKRCQIAIL